MSKATNLTPEHTKIHFFRDEYMEGLYRRPEPLLTVDFNPRTNRLVTAGIQTDIKIWELSYSEEDCLFKLIATMNPIYDSAKVVNIARWSPCGNYIATGCGRGAVMIWKKKGLILSPTESLKNVASSGNNIKGENDDDTDLSFLESEVKPTEEWIIVRKFGSEEGEDVWDLSWSQPLIDHKTGKPTYLLATTSMDRRLRVYQPLESREMLFEHVSEIHSSFGGITWDPLGYYLAIQLSTAKKVLLFGLNQERFSILGPQKSTCGTNSNNNTIATAIANESEQAAMMTSPKKKKKNSTTSTLFEKVGTIKKSAKDNKELFQGDNYTMQYRSTVLNSVRRLSFSPDGSFLFTTAGLSNSLHMFYRNVWKKPAKCITGLTSTCPIVRFSPILYKSINEKSVLPYRMMACASSKDEIIIFDTESNNALFRAQRLFTQPITDCSWSSDGTVLFISSQEGLMAIMRFDKAELGEPYDLFVASTSNNETNSKEMTPLEQHIARIREVLSQSATTLQTMMQSGEEKSSKDDAEVNVLVPKKKTAIPATNN
ncbi:hypothetical protein FDP41_012372 [Naegleria fowleri]|uniref:CAF1B/HIR1 beta-propeller domain-containing protein n=1 Tax=Naegleria fowleri TaxID=5763 RepID=A0A6A5C8J7_NAEFO|nr:uncharacterized protein FDP41_012372 [Naegleria fowleri]KAF0981715.1 hypothetical protein FDP41_012372 [Naegleria fowleri]CAG4712084.1 unnamed protein product [Naegleria fowleri]